MQKKPETSPSREELLQAMEPVKDFIPNGNFSEFFDRVNTAIEIYLETDELSLITKELREINRICRNPNYTLLNVLKSISKTTRDLLEGANLLGEPNPLPPLPNMEDEAGIAALAEEIRHRIIISMKPLSDRKAYSLVGPSRAFKEGCPPKERLSVLVSLVATAYVSTSEKSYRREWNADDELPFHQILEVIFDILGIKASIDEAIRRQKRT